ncbi:MAG: chemotaxis protein CheW [Gemmatimonadaceae bacterium]|nr:chemotaxis protein CheW [Gemmatimonadaceae bacterium]MCW5824940.1 chemotaxis protein CheW [Gemmatimonadaceae bacterium]
MSVLTRVLVARVGAERVAFPVESVREVVDAPAVQPVPLAPDGIAGQVALRDAHLPVLDPAVLLGAARDARGAGVALVLCEPAVALWVDDAQDIWDASSAERRGVPSGADRVGVLQGLLQRGAEVAALVDPTALSRAVVATLREFPR